MSEKEEHYWNSLDKPLLSHTKSCLCAECKVLRFKRRYKNREKSSTEEAEARRMLFEQLESLGIPNPQKLSQLRSEASNKDENIDESRSIVEVENRRKIEAQLKSLGFGIEIHF